MRVDVEGVVAVSLMCLEGFRERSEAVTVERLLFHMVDFLNCSEPNLWQTREAAAAGRTVVVIQVTCLSLDFLSFLNVRTTRFDLEEL